MWQFNQINDINNYIIFNNFDLYIMIARQMRGCHYYYIDKDEYRIYGCDKEGFSLHAVDIPSNISIPASLYFNILELGPNEPMIKEYKSFIMYKDFPWIIFPMETINDHQYYRFSYNGITWNITDIRDNSDKILFAKLFTPELELLTVRKIFNILNTKRSIECYLGEMQLFGDVEKNPIITDIFTNKAANGRKYLRLTNINGKNYGMMIFKNLFNLNKTDTLTVAIRDRLDIPNTFQASFIVNKKKSPIPTIIPFYYETTYATFLNI